MTLDLLRPWWIPLFNATLFHVNRIFNRSISLLVAMALSLDAYGAPSGSLTTVSNNRAALAMVSREALQARSIADHLPFVGYQTSFEGQWKNQFKKSQLSFFEWLAAEVLQTFFFPNRWRLAHAGPRNSTQPSPSSVRLSVQAGNSADTQLPPSKVAHVAKELARMYRIEWTSDLDAASRAIEKEESLDSKKQPASQLVERIREVRELPYAPSSEANDPDAPIDQRRNILNRMEMAVRLCDSPKAFLIVIADLFVRLEELADPAHAADVQKREDICQVTTDIYATLCERMGMSAVAQQLKDRVLLIEDPAKYRETQDAILEQLGMKADEARRYPRELSQAIQKALSAKGIEAQVFGRLKSVSSSADKLVRKSAEYKSVDELRDLLAFSIVLQNPNEMQQALEIVGKLFDERTEYDEKSPEKFGFSFTHARYSKKREGTVLHHEIQIFPSKADYQGYVSGFAAHWVYKYLQIEGIKNQIFDFTSIEIQPNDLAGNFNRLKASLEPWTYFFTHKMENGRATYLAMRIPRHGNVADVAALPSVNQLNENFVGAKIRRDRYSTTIGSMILGAEREVLPDYPIEDGAVVLNRESKSTTNSVMISGWQHALEGYGRKKNGKQSAIARSGPARIRLHELIYRDSAALAKSGRNLLVHVLRAHFGSSPNTSEVESWGELYKSFETQVVNPLRTKIGFADDREFYALIGLEGVDAGAGSTLWQALRATYSNGVSLLELSNIHIRYTSLADLQGLATDLKFETVDELIYALGSLMLPLALVTSKWRKRTHTVGKNQMGSPEKHENYEALVRQLQQIDEDGRNVQFTFLTETTHDGRLLLVEIASRDRKGVLRDISNVLEEHGVTYLRDSEQVQYEGGVIAKMEIQCADRAQLHAALEALQEKIKRGYEEPLPRRSVQRLIVNLVLKNDLEQSPQPVIFALLANLRLTILSDQISGLFLSLLVEGPAFVADDPDSLTDRAVISSLEELPHILESFEAIRVPDTSNASMHSNGLAAFFLRPILDATEDAAMINQRSATELRQWLGQAIWRACHGVLDQTRVEEVLTAMEQGELTLQEIAAVLGMTLVTSRHSKEGLFYYLRSATPLQKSVWDKDLQESQLPAPAALMVPAKTASGSKWVKLIPQDSYQLLDVWQKKFVRFFENEKASLREKLQIANPHIETIAKMGGTDLFNIIIGEMEQAFKASPSFREEDVFDVSPGDADLVKNFLRTLPRWTNTYEDSILAPEFGRKAAALRMSLSDYLLSKNLRVKDDPRTVAYSCVSYKKASTVFFRREDDWNLKPFLDDLIERRWKSYLATNVRPRITARHLAGSTGEESYSVAIRIHQALSAFYDKQVAASGSALLDKGSFMKLWDIRVYSFDSNIENLFHTVYGVYLRSAVEQTVIGQQISFVDIERYFSRVNKTFSRASILLRKWVRPIYLDLDDPAAISQMNSQHYDISFAMDTIDNIPNGRAALIQSLRRPSNQPALVIFNVSGAKPISVIRYPSGIYKVSEDMASRRDFMLQILHDSLSSSEMIELTSLTKVELFLLLSFMPIFNFSALLKTYLNNLNPLVLRSLGLPQLRLMTRHPSIHSRESQMAA